MPDAIVVGQVVVELREVVVELTDPSGSPVLGQSASTIVVQTAKPNAALAASSATLTAISGSAAGLHRVRFTPTEVDEIGDLSFELSSGTTVIRRVAGAVTIGESGQVPDLIALDQPVAELREVVVELTDPAGSPVTGQSESTVVVKTAKPGGAMVASSATLTEITGSAAGLHVLRFTAAEVDTLGDLAFEISTGTTVIRRVAGFVTIGDETYSSSAGSFYTVPEEVTGIARVAGDIALVWSTDLGDADLAVLGASIDDDLETDRGLVTAAVLSLFTDRRAAADDKPPSGDARDRRGWWGDQFAIVQGDRFGSRLWLLARSKRTNDTVLKAKEYVNEGLAWMLEDRVVSSIDVTVETTSKALLFAVGLNRPGRDPVTFRFAHAWNNLQEAA